MASAAAASAYTALVVGSTGAVGRELVAELVASANCAKVIALTRREIPTNEWTKSFPRLDADLAKDKLEIRTVDFDTLGERDIKVEDKIDAAFCTLGTTRKDAGSAEAFRKVDLEYATRFGELTKVAKASYFGLVTTMNADKNSWFLYPQTKGEIEERIKTLDFPRTGIFRPGLIDRGELARTVEKIALWVLPSIAPVAIAKGMLADYESCSSNKINEINNSDLKKFQ